MEVLQGEVTDHDHVTRKGKKQNSNQAPEPLLSQRSESEKVLGTLDGLDTTPTATRGLPGDSVEPRCGY